jgi:hypothetical protein
MTVLRVLPRRPMASYPLPVMVQRHAQQPPGLGLILTGPARPRVRARPRPLAP